jgi:hypothetical protein
MKQTDSSIIIVRNVCVLTSASTYPLHYCTGKQNYLLSNILWKRINISVMLVSEFYVILYCENNIICNSSIKICLNQIFCDLLLKSAFAWIFNVMRVYHIRIIAKKKFGSHDMKQTDSSIIIVRNVCVLTSASMIVYLFITRS